MRLFAKAIFRFSKNVFTRAMSSGTRYIGTTSRGLTKDFSLEVPWGCVSGKMWGDPKNSPVLCLHGWLDNCNTFDKLIPFLPPDHFYVAFDTPGHGFSSHFTQGMFYFTMAYCSVVKRVIDHFKFKEVSIMGHSMGGNIGTHFSGLYPDIVKRVVIIDALGTWFRAKDDMVNSLRSCIDSHLAFENSEDRPQKQYTYDQAKERLKAANKTLDDEAVEILLERSLKELPNGSFVFRRDLRHLFKDPMERTLDSALTVTENVKADVLLLVAKSGLYNEEVQSRFKDIVGKIFDTYSANAKSFQVVKFEGHHHMHLCAPEEIAEAITEFLNTHPLTEPEVQPDGESNL